ncbi:MAG: hypothetical protein Q8Q02_16625 [Nocardioides sp.]|nr:hypothetical protein [Nocardioides sp.]
MSPRQVAVLLSAIVAVVGSTLGSGAFGGTPIDQAAGGALDADATLIAPAGPAFSIWGLIYAALLLLAVVQALPSRRHDARLDAVGWWVAASLLLNLAWIAVVQGGWLLLSLVVIAALTVVLVRTWALLRERAASRAQLLTVDVPLGLYLGWVVAATAANAAAYVDAELFDVEVPYALLLLVVATGLSAGLALAHRAGAAVAGATAWGAAWIAYGRLTGEPASEVVGLVAIGAVVVLLVAGVVSLLRTRSPAVA